ncbi:MAG: DUF3159 domain-containing protein [Mycobacteriales bacterium]
MAERRSQELTTGTLLEAFGGVKGLFDGSLPALVFVVVRLVSDLNTAIVAAVASGLVVVVVRRVRGESLQQAMSGFFGLVLAVLISRATGTGKGFFLPGILITAGSGVAFGASLLAGRPAVALGLAALDPRYAVWREHEPLRQACVRATAVWTASFFVRAGVATAVALTVGDKASDNLVLLVVIQAVKWPLIIGSALYTVAVVRRADVPELVEP